MSQDTSGGLARLPVPVTPTTSDGDTEGARDLLERFPSNERGAIANVFLLQVRRGCDDPTAVFDGVLAELRGRLTRAQQFGDGLWFAKVQGALYIVLGYPGEAMALARWAIAWEALPLAERERIKAERGKEHRQAWLATQPATSRQLAYLRSLGHQGPVASRLHASELIDKLKGGAA